MIEIDMGKHQPATGWKMLLDIGQTGPIAFRYCRHLLCGSSPCQTKPRLPFKSSKHHYFVLISAAVLLSHLNRCILSPQTAKNSWVDRNKF